MKINPKVVARGGLAIVAVLVALRSCGSTAANLRGSSQVFEPQADPQAEYLKTSEFNSGVELQNALFGFDYTPEPQNRGFIQIAFDRETFQAFQDLERLRQTDGTACANTGHRFACAPDAIANNLKRQIDRAIDVKDCDVSKEGEVCRYQLVALDKDGNQVEATAVSPNLVVIAMATRTGAVQLAAAGDDFSQVSWDYGHFFAAVKNLQQAQKTLIQQQETVAIGEKE